MLVECRRTTHRLTRIVDDEVEPVSRLEELGAKRFDARRVSEIETEDLHAMAPLFEIRFARIAGRRVARKASRDDETRAGAKKLEPCLVSDLYASAGEQ